MHAGTRRSCRSHVYPSSLILRAVLILNVLGLGRLPASATGTSGGNVLSLGTGARAIAMGDAFTAQADDVSSLYWNPAGVGILNQSQASFMYNQSVGGLAYHHTSVATPLEYGGIGGSLSYLSFGRIEGFDISGAPTGDVDAHSMVGSFAASWFNGESLSAGLTLKGVQASLADESASGMASDFGITYIHPEVIWDGTLRLAATIRNLGTGLKFIDDRDPFPLEFRCGAAAVQMLDRKFNASLDVGKERDAAPGVYLGAEYWLLPQLALRTGWSGSDREGTGLRAGIGLRVKDLTFDYAFSTYGDLGLTHRYELTYRFGAIRPLLTPEERKLFRRAKLALAEQRYNEAVLLSDSLIDMEPRYRPFKRLVKRAMRGVEAQERAEFLEITEPALKGRDLKFDTDDQEIADLLSIKEETTQTAEVPPPEKASPREKPSPEEYTLSPYVPDIDPTTPLQVTEESKTKPPEVLTGPEIKSTPVVDETSVDAPEEPTPPAGNNPSDETRVFPPATRTEDPSTSAEDIAKSDLEAQR